MTTAGLFRAISGLLENDAETPDGLLGHAADDPTDLGLSVDAADTNAYVEVHTMFGIAEGFGDVAAEVTVDGHTFLLTVQEVNR